ncbi:hypothetical protein [Halonotius pteroides]|uniref:hypothetical protein n=1 Tax=Halonotius pteroides TaxID=268735 RepID=UPI001058C8A4|nr:hypothetical protein [Halonotius pteroides]
MPKGYCLRPKDNPKQLLEADRDENLAWKQYYRAAEALEGLSEGAVTFFDSDTRQDARLARAIRGLRSDSGVTDSVDSTRRGVTVSEADSTISPTLG